MKATKLIIATTAIAGLGVLAGAIPAGASSVLGITAKAPAVVKTLTPVQQACALAETYQAEHPSPLVAAFIAEYC